MQRPAPRPQLDWSPDRAHEFAAALLDVWTSYLAELRDLPVGRATDPAAVRAAVTREVPQGPLPDEEVVAHLRELAFEHSVQVGAGGFMAYITGAGTVPGAAAAMLAAGLNQNLGGWVLSPGATEIETALLSWVAGRLGLPDTCSGAFVTGGATANFIALAVARRALADWDVRRDGVAAGPPMAVYASEDAHDTIDRAADLLGMGSAAVRRVPTDRALRMRPDLLADAIAADARAGVRPLAVVGTAGTTEFGAIDRLDAIADVAAAHGCWFHVDAAYGGPAAMVDGLRARFAGIERADSLTCDPHKWMNIPISSSLVLVREPSAQLRAFVVDTDYTRYNAEAAQDMVLRYQWTPQFTRPFDALPMWVSLLAHGSDAFEARIAHDVELAAWLHERLVDHAELQETIRPELSVVAFRYVPPDLRDDPRAAPYLDALNEQIVYALQGAGRVFPSNAAYEGRYVVRVCLVGFRTEADHLEALVEEAVSHGRRLDGQLRPTELRTAQRG